MLAAGRGRYVRLALVALAGIGALLGVAELVQHLGTDPLADVHAYYDAGQRLNAGLPLYPPGADPDAASFYRYPPLLAIAFRPLALLPFGVAALAWELVMLAALALTLRRIGLRPATLVALGILALPIAWTLAIGQAQMLVTLLLAIASPWSVALAAQLKLTPALAALYWVGRRDGRSLLRFVAWSAAFALVQVVLAPQASLDFLGTLTSAQVGSVTNWSPFALSPLLWVALLVAAVVVAVRLAPTRWGWPVAVLLAVVATPRLLTYMFGSLIAGLSHPGGSPTRPRDKARDTAVAPSGSARASL